MILPLLAIVVVAVLGTWVVRPLAGRRRGPTPPPDTRRAELLEAKHAVYRSILDLELDHQLGKVAPGDYQELRHEHEEEALGLLRELDDESVSLPGEVSGDGAGPLDVLEREIAEARRRRSGR